MRYVLHGTRRSYSRITIMALAAMTLAACASAFLLVLYRNQNSADVMDLRPFADHAGNIQDAGTLASPQITLEPQSDIPLAQEPSLLLNDDEIVLEQPALNPVYVTEVPVQDAPRQAGFGALTPSEGQLTLFSTLATGIQPIARELLLEQTFDDSHDWNHWVALRGNWDVADGFLTQTDTAGVDNAMVYQAPFSHYVLRVPLRHISGTGAGVLFNLPSLTDVSGGHLVRYTDDGSGLFWGYYDPVSGFTGQGYAATEAPGKDWHLLELLSGDASYSIWLDGQLLVENIPLISRQGAVGLTTSNSAVAFHSLQVLQTIKNKNASTNNVSAFAAIAGQWTIDEYEIRQTDIAAADLSVGTGIEGSSYNIEVAIRMPDGADLQDSGAGLLFHMPYRDRIEGAQMARFVEGGNGLVWGTFDANGSFEGQGYVPLDLAPSELQRLALAVNGRTFSIAVNDQTIVENVSALRQRGWIGLTTYRGPVSFRDISFTLGTEGGIRTELAEGIQSDYE